MASKKLMDLLNTIQVANEEGDVTTRRLFEDILSHEEDRHGTFTKLLEK